MTTDTPSPLAEPGPLLERNWIIRKKGLFYRPDRGGYTSCIFTAGRYTEAEARQEAQIEPDAIKAAPASAFPKTYCGAAAADLLRRAGIGEPAGLVWRESEGEQVADTPFVTAYVVTYRPPCCDYVAHHLADNREIQIGEPHPDEASAIAACEAHYAAALLSAWPVVAAGVERLRKALQWYADLPEEWEIKSNGLAYGDWHLLGQMARAALATPPAPVATSLQETTPADGNDNLGTPEAIRSLVEELRSAAEEQEARGERENETHCFGMAEDLRVAANSLAALASPSGSGTVSADAFAMVDDTTVSIEFYCAGDVIGSVRMTPERIVWSDQRGRTSVLNPYSANVSAEAVRAEIARLEAEDRRHRQFDPAWADAHRDTAARLTALLPPVQEDPSS